MLKVDLARAYVGGQKFSEAAGILNGIPEERLPKSAVPVNAAILVGTGRTSEAAALAARATDSTALDLAEVFVNARQPELALKAIARLEGTPKGSVKLFYLKGTAQGLTGDFAGATRSFNRALALAPDSIFTLIALADLNAASKRYPESVSVLERARAADPNSIPVLRRLIEQALNANLQGLVEQTAYLLERKSSLPEDQYLSAAALLQEHEYEAAKRILTGYVAQRPQDSRAFLGLGLSYLNLQHYPEARKAFARALELDPNLMEAQYLMGVLLNKEGDTQGALALFEHVIQVQPKHAKALLDAGSLYLQAGDLEKSKLLLDAAESADATDSNTQYQLSLLYNRLGNADEARKHIDQFRSLKQNKGGTSQASQ
jgi:tetratricopeptide (TPR) repeat protein